MNTNAMKELKTLQADLVTLEGMIGVLKQSAYSDIQPVLIGNSLEVLGEYLSTRADWLDKFVSEGHVF